MLAIVKGSEVTIQKARVQLVPSLYGKKPRRCTIDLFGQRMGKAGCVTLHAGSKEVVAVLRRLADHIEMREAENG